MRVVREAIATTEPAPPERAPAPAAPRLAGVAQVLALQRTAGNAAVVAMLQREPVAEAEQPLANLDPAPGWRAEVELLQQKLNWHRGSARVQLLAVDGKFGSKTKAAVIAFKRARHITPHTVTVDATTWEWLAKPPVSGTPRAGKAGPDYDRMFEDGLLEVTIARGFDEHGNAGPETAQIIQGLTQVRGFQENAEKAHALRKAAGRRRRRREGCGSSRRTSGRRRTGRSTPSSASSRPRSRRSPTARRHAPPRSRRWTRATSSSTAATPATAPAPTSTATTASPSTGTSSPARARPAPRSTPTARSCRRTSRSTGRPRRGSPSSRSCGRPA